MKVINPIGRKPASVEDFKAYTCVCNNEVLKNHTAVFNQPGGNTCSTCWSSCDPGTTGNRDANAYNSFIRPQAI